MLQWIDAYCGDAPTLEAMAADKLIEHKQCIDNSSRDLPRIHH